MRPSFSVAAERMHALKYLRNSSSLTSIHMVGSRYVGHSSMALSTICLSMTKVSDPLAASRKLWASSTMTIIPFGSPDRSMFAIRLSRMSGLRIWMYGAAMTSILRRRSFLAS